jgi:hypothetical protein
MGNKVEQPQLKNIIENYNNKEYKKIHALTHYLNENIIICIDVYTDKIHDYYVYLFFDGTINQQYKYINNYEYDKFKKEFNLNQCTENYIKKIITTCLNNLFKNNNLSSVILFEYENYLSNKINYRYILMQ